MRYLLGLTLLLIITFYAPAPLPAGEEGRIDDVVITSSTRDVLLYFQMRDFISSEMEQGIESGLPLTLTFFVEVYRHRWGWWDRKLVDLEFRHVLQYDSLKEEYLVDRTEGGLREVATTSLVEARDLLGRISGMPVIPLEELEAEQTYTLRIKARLADKSRPPLLSRLRPFRRLWSFETDWYSVEFRY